jgi:Spy/CpxP family protein refolding chaperone
VAKRRHPLRGFNSKNLTRTRVNPVMALAMAVPFAIAQSKDAGEHRHGMRGGSHMAGAGFRNLDLTDAQKTQMKQIRDSHSQTLSPLMEQIRAKRQEIRQASESGTFIWFAEGLPR